MHRSRLGAGVLVVCLVALASARCGSSSSNPDAGPAGASNCAKSGPSEGVACAISLTGAVTSSFACTSAFANYNPTTGITSLVQIGAQNVPGVKSIDITLAVSGRPGSGQPALVVATAASKPNNVVIFLNDTLNTAYQTYFTGAGEMSLTVSAADQDTGTGGTGGGGSGTELWCVHGNLKADVPDLTNPASIIHLDAGF